MIRVKIKYCVGTLLYIYVQRYYNILVLLFLALIYIGSNIKINFNTFKFNTIAILLIKTFSGKIIFEDQLYVVSVKYD